jgi:hypothetical protein
MRFELVALESSTIVRDDDGTPRIRLELYEKVLKGGGRVGTIFDLELSEACYLGLKLIFELNDLGFSAPADVQARIDQVLGKGGKGQCRCDMNVLLAIGCQCGGK